jgi:hypothetical protein
MRDRGRSNRMGKRSGFAPKRRCSGDVLAMGDRRAIERHYGALLDGALEGIAERPDAFHAAPDEQVEERH